MPCPPDTDGVIVYCMTENRLLVPVWLEPDVVMTSGCPGPSIVTCPDQTPVTNAFVKVGTIVPVESYKVFEPV